MELYFCFNVYCNILLRSAGPPVNVTCNIFINSFGSVTETTMVSATMPLLQEKTWIDYAMNTTCQIFIYCSTCRTSCKCYLQHIYQQLWVNSRNYNGEDWALKPSCEGMGCGSTKGTVVHLWDIYWGQFPSLFTSRKQLVILFTLGIH